MEQCYYSIIPTPEEKRVCACCGKEIDGLPNYTQIGNIYLCYEIKRDERHYLGLGLGVPMCDDCDYDTTEILERTNRNHNLTFKALGVAFIILLWIMDGESSPVVLVLGFAILAFTILHKKSKHAKENDKVKDKGLDKIMPALEKLNDKGWSQRADDSNLPVNGYNVNKFSEDLDSVCGDGAYTVLDNATGMIADYRDETTLRNICDNSCWRLGY